MARLARRKRSARGSDRQHHLKDQIKSAKPSFNRERMESGRNQQDGIAALSRTLPILCPRWRIELPALSTKRRSFFGRAVQYRLLLAPHVNGRASMRSSARRFRSYLRRSTSLPKPSRANSRTTHSRLSAFAADEIKSAHQKHPRFQIRRLRTRRLRPAPVNQSADCSLRLLGIPGVSKL